MIRAIIQPGMGHVDPRPRKRTMPVTDHVDPEPRKRVTRSFKTYDVRRAMAAVQAGGLDVVIVEIGADGSIRLASAQALPERPADEFERWAGRL